MARKHWLVKQEPATYAWAVFAQEKGSAWTGIRNFQARNFLRAMQPGDAVLYYHSGADKAVVGLAEVSRAAYADPTAQEGDWSAVDLVPVKPLHRPVPLAEIKAEPTLKHILLVRHTRLSVLPLTPSEFAKILTLSNRAP